MAEGIRLESGQAEKRRPGSNPGISVCSSGGMEDAPDLNSGSLWSMGSSPMGSSYSPLLSTGKDVSIISAASSPEPFLALYPAWSLASYPAS